MSHSTIRIPAPLRSLTGGKAEVEASGATVGEAISHLVAAHAGLKDRLLDDAGNLRPFINIYVGDENIRALDGVATVVPAGSVLHLVPAVAGGSADRAAEARS